MTREKDTHLLIFYIGTRRLTAVLAELFPGTLRILRFKEMLNPEGFQKGGVVQLEKAQATVGSLVKALELGEEAFDLPTYVLLSNPQLKMTRFSSSTYYSGYPRVVTSHEVNRVVEQTRSVAPLPLEDWILQAVPESFWVNDLTGVLDPIGLEAQRLAVDLQIFTTHYASFRNISRVFESLEFNLQGYYPKTLVLPEGILNAGERESEALILDVSGDVIHLVITRDGRTLQAKSLALGSSFLTSRIAEHWKLGVKDAERLKERFGSLEENIQFGEELIPLMEHEGSQNHHIKRADFHRNFLEFGGEWWSLLKKELDQLLERERISARPVIVTGGGARLEGLIEFLGKHFSASARLGTPRHLEAPAELLMDSSWAGTLGLLRWLADEGREKQRLFAKENLLERTFDQLKEWLTAYF